MDVQEVVELKAHEIRQLETEKARRFVIGDRKVWIPKSQIKSYEGGLLEIPEWLAQRAGVAPSACPSVPDPVQMHPEFFQYAVSKKAKIKHIWTGQDTACHGFSGGGMNRRRVRVYDRGIDHIERLPTCQNCASMWGRQ